MFTVIDPLWEVQIWVVDGEMIRVNTHANPEGDRLIGPLTQHG